jgi:hypothetical protein
MVAAGVVRPADKHTRLVVDGNEAALGKGFGQVLTTREGRAGALAEVVRHSQPPVHSVKRGRGGYAGWRVET